MRRIPTPALLLAALLAAGCETTPPEPSSTSVSASTAARACAREPRTGSNLPPKDCAAPMSEADRAQAIENMRVKNPSTSTVKSSGGG